MSKTKKIIVVLFTLLFLVVTSVSVSAQTISGTTTIDNFNVTSVDFIVNRNGTSYDGGNVSTYYDSNKVELRLNLNSDIGTLKSNDVVTVVIELYPTLSALRNSQNNVTGSFQFYMKADSTTMYDYDVYRESTTGIIQQADRTLESYWADYWTCSFNDASIGASYDKYCIMFSYRVDADFTTYARYIYLNEFDFYFQNAQEYETDRIIDNQDKNTQAIIDNQNEIQENERNEANTTGDDGVDEITSFIPNDSDGFINALGDLVDAMSYNGTECNWTIPSVSIPKIDGIMPSIKLWDELEIPFEYWIGKIPSAIMTLIRSLLTIALIIYCFKELYSIISYVLTLKGGGASE